MPCSVGSRRAAIVKARESGLVLFIANVFHPVGGLSVDLLLNGHMGHRRGCRGPMPVFLTGRNPDHVTRVYGEGPQLLAPFRKVDVRIWKRVSVHDPSPYEERAARKSSAVDCFEIIPEIFPKNLGLIKAVRSTARFRFRGGLLRSNGCKVRALPRRSIEISELLLVRLPRKELAVYPTHEDESWSMLRKLKTPAILALKRGGASAIRSII